MRGKCDMGRNQKTSKLTISLCPLFLSNWKYAQVFEILQNENYTKSKINP